ncbi:MAG TPA: M2 family metallopeptidase [Thermoanaerobaculia bacterium]|jgi:peptidyl-dipeptidase A|nr:M2 family metallopeptidase [Thermoanaerobaculia bacterium]
MKNRSVAFLACAGLLLVLAAGPAAAAAPKKSAAKPTAAEARKFLEDASKRLLDLSIEAGRAAWVQENFITEDTQILAAARGEVLTGLAVELAKQATRFDGVELAPDQRRQMELLKRTLVLPAPADPKKNAELSRLAASLGAQYGSGKYCPEGGGECKSLPDIEDIMRNSRDPKELLDTWVGWHKISPPMRADYARLVEIANQGARELGYKDTGELWRAKYDMPPEAFGPELDRLWGQLKPLYDSLHCYVRARLNQKYGDAVVPLGQPIPAHVLGNMWAQQWDQIYDVVAPPSADPGYDLTKVLQAKKVDEVGMVKYGEKFFVSLGFAPLPQTFWERSLFKKPQDRDVVCHASAWSIDYKDDLRMKVCVKINDEDFRTVHHELGHNFYQRAYNTLPVLFQDSANDGFHEAVGDTIALSITPEYLKEIGLIDQVPDESKDIGLLLKRALEKVAFLPFGLLIDQWRWKVFSGEVTPADYNKAWWDLRLKYQGVRPPVARSEADFDPGAKYHVPANTPYMRYFLADILQFQLHRGLCQAAGFKGPLHRCSIYGNKEAGARLAKMLELGASRPWPDALEAVTGQRQMDATAIGDYFAPLKTWLDQQNQGQKCGW